MLTNKNTDFYCWSINDTLASFNTKKHGLTSQEAQERLKRDGYNKLPEEKQSSWIKLLLAQFNSILIYILLAAAAINFGLVCQEHGKLIFNISNQADTYIILFTVVINVIVGFFQESKAQKSLSALKKIITLNARVIRDNQEQVINAQELVVGDVVIINAGDKIPADARLISVASLEINEAALTGESQPIVKQIEKLNEELVIGDQINMIFTGTTVTKGQGVGIVVRTGEHTEIGKIAKLIKDTKEEKTPLQVKLEKFSKNVGVIVLIIAALLILVGLIQGDPFIEIFTVSVAIAVSALPEGLAIAVTVILALGMQRILKQKALVRKLVAAETLGSTTVICTDKTGTLTEGKMQVTNIVTWDHDFAVSNFEDKSWRSRETEEVQFALHAGLMCNDAKIDNIDDDIKEWVISGNLTEKALILAAVEGGLEYKKEIKDNKRLDAIPFDSEIKYMATLHELDSKNNIIYIKGAPEKILKWSKFLRKGDEAIELDDAKRKKFQQKFIALSNKGLRIIAIAYKRVSADHEKLDKTTEQDLIFIGYFGIKDPLRPTSKETVEQCQHAGIKVVMITGDHKLTATAIAKDLGLPHQEGNILEGSDLDKLNETELENIVENITVYARVSPEHKLRIVKAFYRRGEVVAMTGDGINDSPALKAADIGVALGSGTQVAKETADMVILDDNFKSIVGAVHEGRGIFDNIKKTVLYLISDSFSEVILIIGSMLMGLPLPLTAAQILWVNLVNDTMPNLALTQEPKEPELMDEPPKGRKSPILDKQIKILIGVISIFSGIASLVLFYIYFKMTNNYVLSSTVAFALLGTDSLIYIFSIRTLRHSILKYNIFKNIYLILGVGFSFLMMLASLYVPFMQTLIKTAPLSIFDWLIIIIISLCEVFVIEVTKYLYARKNDYAK